MFKVVSGGVKPGASAESTGKRSGILLVEDHAVMREGLCELISHEPDLRIVGEAEDHQTALALCERLHPDAAIIDLSLRHDSGLQLIKELRETYSELAMLVLSMHDEKVFAMRALQHGANGYVMKYESAAVLLRALRRVLAGNTYVSETVSQMMLESIAGRAAPPRGRSGLTRLSGRELEILRLMGQGLKTSRIAGILGLSSKTVDTHRERIKEKLAVETAAELVVMAVNWLRDGLLELPAAK